MTAMHVRAALLSLTLCLSAGAEPPAPAADIQLRADRVIHEVQLDRWAAEGHVVLRSPELHLRANELLWDARAERITARGDVLLVQDGYVAVAREVDVSLSDSRVTLVEGLILGKQGVSRAALEAAATRKDLLALGRNEVAIRGERITRVSPDHFRVEGLSFTPCDCDMSAPSWAVRAALADVWPGQRAILHGWKVEVGDVQVTPPLPWLDLPLADRRTGFLIPRPSFSQTGGFGFALPFFLELGQSHDLTFTPGATFGPNAWVYGMLGPSLGIEYRYAPAVGVLGSARVTGYWDLREDRAPLSAAPIPDTQRGLRWDAVVEHRQELGRVGRLTADLRLVSDGFLPRDVTPDVLLRESQYLRSTASLAARGPDAYAGLDAILRQDLRTGHRYRFFLEDLAATGTPTRAPATLQRLPGLAISLPDRPLLGPLFGSLRVDASRLAPWVGEGGDEGLNGFSSVLFLPGVPATGPDLDAPLRAPDEGEGNGRLDPGESERRVRLDLKPSASLPVAVGPLALLGTAAWRQSLTLGEVTGRVEHRGLPLLAASAETRLSREFSVGAGEARLVHAISPRVQTLWVPFTVGGLTGRGELWDTPLNLALPAQLQPERLAQTTVSVRQRLDLRGAPDAPSVPLVLLEVGQDLAWSDPLVDEAGPVLADAFARLESSWAGLSMAGILRVRPQTLEVVQAALDLGYASKNWGLSGRYDLVRHDGNDRLNRGVDALFALGSSVPSLAAAQQVSLSARSRTPVPGLGLQASALFQPAYTVTAGELSGKVRPFAQGAAGVAYAPACDCWTLALDAGATRTFEGTYVPLFTASLTLANFGRLGAP